MVPNSGATSVRASQREQCSTGQQLRCEAFRIGQLQLITISSLATALGIGLWQRHRRNSPAISRLCAICGKSSQQFAGPLLRPLWNSPVKRQDRFEVNAERTLTKEFGPYAVGEGLPSCVAPIRLVEECDGNCRSCEWLWLNQQPPSERSSAVPLPLLVCCTDSCKPFAGRNSGPLAKTNAFRPVGSGGPLREFA